MPRLRLLLAFLFLATTASAEPFRATVLKVYDGDTVVVRDSRGRNITIRLEGIDAPERYQPFATKSRDALRQRLLRKTVTIVPRDVDRYERIVGIVLVGGADAGLEQLRSGLAWHFRQFEARQEYRNRIAYSAAERDARLARLGLWSQKNPVPPWRYRWGNRRPL